MVASLFFMQRSIGPVDLTVGKSKTDSSSPLPHSDAHIGTLFPATTSTVPTVTDNLFKQGLIPANQVGIYFAPTTQQSVQNGELTYGTFILAHFPASRSQRRSGGADSSKYTGSISYTPVTTTSPASRYWGINQSIRYGSSTNILSTTAGIVDTGSSSLLF